MAEYSNPMDSSPISFRLTEMLSEARERTLALVAGLDNEQMIGPRLNIVNPLRWEIWHVAWFQEFWILRQMQLCAPILAGVESLYDSSRLRPDPRWHPPPT